MTENVYLKQSVVAEPLFNQWYAWSYLISPATAAMYTANSHLKIMRSFVSAPQVHVAALKNPAMIGGPFINYEANRAGEIGELIGRTVKDQSRLLELAEAIKTTDEMLQTEASGHSLESLYQKIPDVLKGYVELVYDLNNHPCLRLIEGLLYRSPYYNTDSQSVALFIGDEEKRPFALSSPNLLGSGQIHIRAPFKAEVYDELFKMKYEPRPIGDIKELLNIEEKDAELFSSFFTQEAPPPRTPYTGEDIRVRYFGHACVLVETKEVSILCDPVISYQCDGGICRYTYADLPEQIDYVLITHNHQDHCMFETLLQLRHKIKNIIVPRNNAGSLADPSLKLVLKSIGFSNVQAMDEVESIAVPGGTITALPFMGEHGDLDIRTKAAYLINLKGKSVLCAADSNNIEPKLYKHLHDLVGNVDVVFLGMECDGAPLTWLYGPLLTKPLARKMDQSRRFDGSDYTKGMNLIKQLNPSQAYVYAMGQEPWLKFLTSIQYTEQSRPIVESNKLVEHCGGQGIVAERLFGQKQIVLSAN